jgi:asparagine synthase (glutamine-hydrolysing)
MEEEGEILEFPAMALSDAGLFFLCLQVSGTCHTVLTGTGGGCILGGSLWPEGEGGTFLPLPRSTALPLGRQIFDPGLWHSSGVEEHGRDHLSRLLDCCPTLDGESPRETQRRRESWLAFNWLLPALLARNERLGRASGLDLRSPLCDHLLVEYAWNIPWSMKTANGRPLQLLRDGTEDLLPQAVRDRAALPHILAAESLYGQLVRARLARLLDDTNAPIRPLVEERALRRLLMEDGGAPVGSSIPKAHVMAYLVQLNRWMEVFHLSV